MCCRTQAGTCAAASLPVCQHCTNRRSARCPPCAAQVGGGPTGVELAAELHDLVKEDIARLQPQLRVGAASPPAAAAAGGALPKRPPVAARAHAGRPPMAARRGHARGLALHSYRVRGGPAELRVGPPWVRPKLAPWCQHCTSWFGTGRHHAAGRGEHCDCGHHGPSAGRLPAVRDGCER